jgi:N-methylhydantoinase B
MDKTTYEILRSSFYTIAREMKTAMMQTAASPIIHAGGDASAAVFSADMELVAQGNDIPTMLGSAAISTKVCVNAIGKDKLKPGDVIISNDAYLGGGNHQPDVQLTRPVFCDGELIAFTMTRGHWSDLGGQTPGSYDPATWDIFGEGVRIPPVLIFRDDRLVDDLVKVIVTNTRDPENRIFDIKAQYAGVFVGDQRLNELAAKYGAATLRQAMKQSLDHSEKLMRAQIAAIPDGIYEAEDFIEPVGANAQLIPVRVRIEVKGDDMTFDYSGSGDQVRGGINCPYAVTCNSTWFAVKAVTDVTIPINEGCYRPIRIVAPEGSILNCRFPASVVSGNGDTSPRVIDMLLRALSPALPERVIADSYDSACTGIFSGVDSDQERKHALKREFAVFVDVHGGGLGARPKADGVSAIRVHVGNTSAQPIELLESYAPLQVEEWSLVADSGGAGKTRGGLASRRSYRINYDEASCSVLGERGTVAPKGLFGGLEGSPFVAEIHRAGGGVERLPTKGERMTVNHGDLVVIQPAGSGGYGDPLTRAAELVVQDVRDGYVSPEQAHSRYGVAVDAQGKLNEEETRRIRRGAGG